MLTRQVLRDSLKGESEEGVSRSERRMLRPPEDLFLVLLAGERRFVSADRSGSVRRE